MRTSVRTGLVILLAAQAWFAVEMTRYYGRFLRGELAWEDWRAEEALEAFDEARRIRDADSEVWRRNGDMALYMQNYPDQVDTGRTPDDLLDHAWGGYAGAVLRCPLDSWSWTGLADVAVNRAKLQDAREGIDLAELDRLSRGILDPDRGVALAAAELAVRLKPAGFQELDVLASVYEAMGDVDRAERTYAESAQMMPVVSYHVWGNGRRLDRRLYEAILPALEAGIEQAPSFERNLLHWELARFARSQGDYPTAIRHAEIAKREARSPNDVYRSNHELSRVLERVGRFEESLAALLRAREYVRDPGGLSRKQGMLELRAGRVEDACVSLREALRREPDDDGLRMQTAGACEQAGESELAEQILKDGFTAPMDNLTLARSLIEFHRRHGRDRLADYLLRTWARDYPEQPELQVWLDQARTPSP